MENHQHIMDVDTVETVDHFPKVNSTLEVHPRQLLLAHELFGGCRFGLVAVHPKGAVKLIEVQKRPFQAHVVLLFKASVHSKSPKKRRSTQSTNKALPEILTDVGKQFACWKHL